MNRRHFIALTLGTGGLIELSRRSSASSLQRVEAKSWALGADVVLVAYHKDRSRAEQALTAAFRSLDELENVLSLYRPNSQICRLNQTGFLEGAHPDLIHVLGHALKWSRLSAGAFDPTVQPLWNLYAQGRTPAEPELHAVCQRVDWKQVRIHGGTIQLAAGQAITLNGIAQGYAADRVRDILHAHGIHHALANTGELGALGAKPDGIPWRVGIQHPRHPEAYIALTALEDRFLATSGDYETTFTPDFSSNHIFDPATGHSPASLASVTVLAKSGLEADALSTAIFVLGPAEGLKLVETRAGADALLVLKNGGVLTTRNFPRLAA